MALKREQLNEEKRQFNATHSSSGGSGSGSKITASKSKTVTKAKEIMNEKKTNKVLNNLKSTAVDDALAYLKGTKAFKNVDNPFFWLK